MTLALLQDGACSIREQCRKDATSVAADCPQLFKCGSCLMWSVRAESRTRRNDGVCLLERDATHYLDCNAPACPYYRPRPGSPAREQVRIPSPARARTRSRPLGREAPPPTPAALAIKAAEGAGGSGVLTGLCLELGVRASGALPPLLERFRGGTAELVATDGKKATVPLERWYLWICAVKRGLDGLENAVAQSALPGEEREKISKDIKGMRGTMTTFNLLFKDKEDHFVGQKGG
ncbi:MAG: hypothetical protein AB2A00_42390 [Myxococcota bacterium]